MEDDLLSRVIKETMGNSIVPKPYLTPEQEEELLGNMDYEAGKTMVYRQFSPMRDSMQYTIYYVTEGVKRRVDFEVHMEDFKDAADLNRMVTVVAKAVIHSHRSRDLWEQNSR